MMPVFKKAIPLLKQIENAGFEAYFVGGSVRDYLLGKEIADVDIATSATPEEVKQIFPKTLDIGIEHGTVVVLFKGTPYEVTTFRTESEYVDFRRPSEVHFIRSLHEDLQRRDFTMNAIAMDMDGNFIDPFYGKQSISEKVIKTVGNAEERFKEDALRMMRAIRFNSQLAFEIDPFTAEALASSGYLLEKIAVERKLSEFEKLLAGKNRKNALKKLAETGLYKYLPGMAPFRKELNHTIHLDSSELSVEEMWGFLIYCFGMDQLKAEAFMKHWKMSGKKTKRILKVFKWLEYRFTSNWTPNTLYEAGGGQTVESTERILNVLRQENVETNISSVLKSYESLPIKDKSELKITGNDLMTWFDRPQGSWIKAELEKAEKAVLNRDIDNSKDSIREWLIKCNQS